MIACRKKRSTNFSIRRCSANLALHLLQLPANFDHIAPYYDTLATIVFGNKLSVAKGVFLDEIPASGQVLLVGEGTGNLLNLLLQREPTLTIDYLDASSKMIELTRKKVPPAAIHRVRFLQGTHHHLPSQKKYDAVMAFFVIDCLRQREAMEFTASLTNALKKEGCFLMADFFPPKKILHRALLWMMYRFFRLVADLNTAALPDYEILFNGQQLAEAGRSSYMNGFIQSRIYRKI